MTHRRLGAAAVLLVLLGTAAGWPVRAAASLPACRYDDVLTRYTAADDWAITLLDTIERLPRPYAPADLASTTEAGLNGGFRIRSLVIPDLEAMTAAASANGTPVAVNSAYRSFQKQKKSFWKFVAQTSYANAIRYGARPGHSEHQLGTTIDFRSADDPRAPWAYRDWSRTPAGAWMKANAWRYGFVMSYPRHRRAVTCMSYEPWHYRYLGRAEAAAIHEAGVTPREYLWKTYESGS